ncbi:hypothetical protein [Glutamicibacter arilaitensis]|uniref:Uncharacterized protein n=1 Tax=Glutamicibacter arilaitensis TaxID=256701 RepID=A0A2N7S681_9MICC|nr:hypothetical protein [Glutamicibacter arilaitensis]PMQ21634.1 hypothetical protein CIK84_08920 [Glutamicibacter arilaitensis]
MKKRESSSKAARSGLMSIGAAIAIYVLLIFWTPAGPWAGALHWVLGSVAAFCMYRGVFLQGKADGMRVRTKDRSTMFALGYRLGLLESSGIHRAQRVEVDGETIYEGDKE